MQTQIKDETGTYFAKINSDGSLGVAVTGSIPQGTNEIGKVQLAGRLAGTKAHILGSVSAWQSIAAGASVETNLIEVIGPFAIMGVGPWGTVTEGTIAQVQWFYEGVIGSPGEATRKRGRDNINKQIMSGTNVTWYQVFDKPISDRIALRVVNAESSDQNFWFSIFHLYK